MKRKAPKAKHSTEKAVYPNLKNKKVTVTLKKPSVKGAGLPVKKMSKGHK